MKKVSTVVAQRIGKVQGQGLTIGMDLGDRSSWYCVLDEAGRVVLEEKLSTTANALFYVAPLLVLTGGSSLSAFTAQQLQALALMFLKLNAYAFDIYLVFFGLWCIVTGYLIMCEEWGRSVQFCGLPSSRGKRESPRRASKAVPQGKLHNPRLCQRLAVFAKGTRGSERR
jgi:hypothetical protein